MNTSLKEELLHTCSVLIAPFYYFDFFCCLHALVSLTSLQNGVTALDRAKAAGHTDIVHLLQTHNSTGN